LQCSIPGENSCETPEHCDRDERGGGDGARKSNSEKILADTADLWEISTVFDYYARTNEDEAGTAAGLSTTISILARHCCPS